MRSPGLLGLLVAAACCGPILGVDPTPVVIWHGMGDSCCNPLSMGKIQKWVEEETPGVYVKSLMFGNNIVEDTEMGFFANMNDIIDDACEQIQSDPKLQDGYHALGFSQGGLFLRALAQRCDWPKPKNLISIGGPQHGVYGLPRCPGNKYVCNAVRKLLNFGAYNRLVQERLVQAQYWDDPIQNDDFKDKSIFLADINCARECNQTKYKNNLVRLDNLVLVKFLKDSMVVPKDSEWFGSYAPNNISVIVDLKDSDLYKNDLIGLRTLDESGKLHFLTSEGDHLRFTHDFFVNEIVRKYLSQ